METEIEKKQQFSLRPPSRVHERLSEAAAWRGQTLHAFVLGAATREADDVLAARNRIRPTGEDASMILRLLDEDEAPNQAMADAIRLHNEALGEAV